MKLTTSILALSSGLALIACTSGPVSIANEGDASQAGTANSTDTTTATTSSATSSTSSSGATMGSATSGSTTSFGTDAATPCSISGAQPTDVYGVACYPASDMPSGSCSGATMCSFCSVPTCQGSVIPPRTGYTCVCNGNEWKCSVAWQDTSVCLAAVPDASAD